MATQGGILDRRFLRLTIFMTILAAGLRLPGIFTDFSFDEIWSLNLAHEAGSIAKIFSLHHDNNHWLNTIFLLVLGDQHNWVWYRTLALVTGIAVIPLAGIVARRHFDAFAGVIAMVFLAFSFLFVSYSSEARGYAPATCFAMVAFLALDCWFGRTNLRASWPAAVLFNCAVV